MATRVRAPRRRVAVHANADAPHPALGTQIVQAATSPTARLVYIAVGTAGLAALAIAIFGPRRFQREILSPAGNAVGSQAGKLWDESRPLREQVAELFGRAQNAASREKLARSFQSWIGHFRAT